MIALLLAATLAQATYTKDVAPILFARCAPCHRPGESAPFPLLSYRDARSHARQIVAVTRRRYMPPWPPEPGYGQFAGDRRLTAAQLLILEQWLQGGLLEGRAEDLPRQPGFPSGWSLGTPDLVVQAPRPYTLAASGPDVFRNFVIPVPVGGQRFVRAVEIRPGNKRVVHHANLLVDRRGSTRQRDGADGAPGFPGMDVTIESSTFEPESHFLFWKPGTPAETEPESMAWRIDPGTDLVLNMHLQPSGKPEAIQPSVGLFFTGREPTRFPMLLQLEADASLDIPAGRASFAVSDQVRLPVDADVLGVYPHAHYIGKRIDAWAVKPDGLRVPLIRITDWDINWQAVYRYREPVFLPRDSVIHMRWTYDNSAANPRNPSRPPLRVTAGDQSVDEMAHLWVQVLTRGGDQRLKLQESVMRQKLRRMPGDFTRRFNLGAALLSQGRTAEAIAELLAALAIQPANPAARTALGAALQESGQIDAAIAEYREALRRDPSHWDARYNLANSLAETGRFADAAGEYRVAIQAKPSDAAARKRFALSLQGAASALSPAESVPLLEEAVAADPQDADAHTNLGTALARVSRIPEAIRHFQRALELQPGHAVAERNLRLALRNRQTRSQK